MFAIQRLPFSSHCIKYLTVLTDVMQSPHDNFCSGIENKPRRGCDGWETGFDLCMSPTSSFTYASLVYSLSFLHPTPPPSSGIIFSDFSILYCFPSRQIVSFHFYQEVIHVQVFTFLMPREDTPAPTLSPPHFLASLCRNNKVSFLEFSPYPNTHCWTTTVNTSEKASFLLLSFA